jgi:hypothetical protein
MRVVNIHERKLPVPTWEVGALIDSLASQNDRLWPRTMWPAMRFDRPLGLGATGGHGPIRYTVIEWHPGEMVRFRFSAPRGFNGHHWLEVVPADGVNSVLRHTLEMDAQGPALLSWPLLFRSLHDACVEDALSMAERSLGIEPSIRPWSLGVKALRWLLSAGKARPQEIPCPVLGRPTTHGP